MNVSAHAFAHSFIIFVNPLAIKLKIKFCKGKQSCKVAGLWHTLRAIKMLAGSEFDHVM